MCYFTNHSFNIRKFGYFTEWMWFNQHYLSVKVYNYAVVDEQITFSHKFCIANISWIPVQKSVNIMYTYLWGAVNDSTVILHFRAQMVEFGSSLKYMVVYQANNIKRSLWVILMFWTKAYSLQIDKMLGKGKTPWKSY